MKRIDDDDDEWDDDDFGDIEDGDTEDYTPVIQNLGKAVSGATRKVEVSNTTSGIEFTGFYGIGCNVFPSQFTLYAQQKEGSVPAYSELYAKRFNDISLSYARSWFQVDWFVTNEAGDDYKDYEDNWEDNPDYKNWINGVYNFYSDEMNSAVEYWQMLEDAGTEIYLAYNWKNAKRIQAWFGNDPFHAEIAAPRDLEAYAKAAAALFKHVRNERGLTNFNTLAFYNEPDRANGYDYEGSWDYTTIGDKALYWMNMVKACHEVFSNDPELEDVQIASADCSNLITAVTDNYVNPYLRNHGGYQYFDMFTFHVYATAYTGRCEEGDTVYDTLIKMFTFVENWYPGNNNWITEYYSTDIGFTAENHKAYMWENYGWSHSAAGMFIACANTGIHGLFKWTILGHALPDPINGNVANGETSSWATAVSVDTAIKVMNSYYQESLLNTYVKNDSNVHNITWEGDDIRCSAFTTKDGKDFSLVVEANEDSVDRVVDVTLKKSLGGKKLYVYAFDHSKFV